MSRNGKNVSETDYGSEAYLRSVYGDEAYEASEDPQFRIKDWGIKAYEGAAPSIDYLIDGVLPKATPGLIASSGGLGKSYLLLDLCVRVASEPGEFGQFAMGGSIKERGVAVMVTAEDSYSAVHRRLDQILHPSEKPDLDKHLYIVPLPDAGGSVTFMRTLHGEFVMTKAWKDFCEQLDELGKIDLIVLDPLQTLVASDITSDPASAQAYWSAVSALCAKTGACVLTAHHMRKNSGEITSVGQAKEAVRGTSALTDGSRWSYVLYPANDEERETASQALGYTVGPLEFVWGAVVKSNDIGTTEPRAFLRDPETGLLIDRTEELGSEISAIQSVSDEQRERLFDEVRMRWSAARPFSSHPNAGPRWIGRWMVEQLGVTRGSARQYVKEWIADGSLIKGYHSTARVQGVRVA